MWYYNGRWMIGDKGNVDTNWRGIDIVNDDRCPPLHPTSGWSFWSGSGFENAGDNDVILLGKINN